MLTLARPLKYRYGWHLVSSGAVLMAAVLAFMGGCIASGNGFSMSFGFEIATLVAGVRVLQGATTMKAIRESLSTARFWLVLVSALALVPWFPIEIRIGFAAVTLCMAWRTHTLLTEVPEVDDGEAPDMPLPLSVYLICGVYVACVLALFGWGLNSMISGSGR